MLRYRRQHGLSGLWPVDEGGRLLGGALLLVWGISLAAQGLGLDQGPLATALRLYWAMPFVVWGLLGFLWHLAQGTSGTMFYLIVAALGAVVEAGALHLAHLDFWTLFFAVVLVGAGLMALRDLLPRRRNLS
jgi:peptidoglycan/LPS O-acetylase OafA/YrhL